VQVGWLLQLARRWKGKWILHIDGKHKLHHGKWLLVTFGTHVTSAGGGDDSRRTSITHRFRPLVYMFTKHHEDADSIYFGLKAMELVVRMCDTHRLHAYTFTFSFPLGLPAVYL